MPTVVNKMQRVLFDVNVCIDLIVNRSISPEIKKKLFAVLLQNDIEAYWSACSPEDFRKAVTLTFSIIVYFWEHETIHAHCSDAPGCPADVFMCHQKTASVRECIEGGAFRKIRSED